MDSSLDLRRILTAEAQPVEGPSVGREVISGGHAGEVNEGIQGRCRSIGQIKALFTPSPRRPASAGGRCSLVAMAAASACSGSLPQRLAARRSAVFLVLDMMRRMDEDRAFKGSPGRRPREGLGRLRGGGRYDLASEMRDPGEEGSAYTMHNDIVGARCFQRIAVDLGFDHRPQIVDQQITGGEFLTEETYRLSLE
jgi:hypothetical protein